MLKESLVPSNEMQKWFDKKWQQYGAEDSITVRELEKMLPALYESLFSRNVENPQKLSEQVFGDIFQETVTNESTITKLQVEQWFGLGYLSVFGPNWCSQRMGITENGLVW